MIETGKTVTIEGHRCPYVVRHLHGLEDGTYYLELMPTEPPRLIVTLEGVHEERDGRLYTEDLDEIEPAQEPVVDREAASGVSACKSCGAPIRYSVTKAGKRTPMNLDGTSHWGTCPQAPRWRKSTARAFVAHGEETVAPTPDQPAGQLSLF